MLKFISIVISCIVLLSSPLYAEIVHVDLSELTGYYSGDSITTCSAHFIMPRIPSEVHSVSIRFCGVTDTGLLNCEGAYGQRILGPWWTWYHFSMLDSTTGDQWETHLIYEDSLCSLDTTKTFSSPSGATWEFLKNGSGEITFEWYPLPYVLTCYEVRKPSVILYYVHLIVDGVFIVPTEQTTWGEIKSIYSSIE